MKSDKLDVRIRYLGRKEVVRVSMSFMLFVTILHCVNMKRDPFAFIVQFNRNTVLGVEPTNVD